MVYVINKHGRLYFLVSAGAQPVFSNRTIFDPAMKQRPGPQVRTLDQSISILVEIILTVIDFSYLG